MFYPSNARHLADGSPPSCFIGFDKRGHPPTICPYQIAQRIPPKHPGSQRDWVWMGPLENPGKPGAEGARRKTAAVTSCRISSKLSGKRTESCMGEPHRRANRRIPRGSPARFFTFPEFPFTAASVRNVAEEENLHGSLRKHIVDHRYLCMGSTPHRTHLARRYFPDHPPARPAVPLASTRASLHLQQRKRRRRRNHQLRRHVHRHVRHRRHRQYRRHRHCRGHRRPWCAFLDVDSGAIRHGN